jgi:hypothetical protein
VPEFGYGRETRIYRNDGTGHFARATTGLPNLFSNPSPIDLDGSGRQGFVSLGGDGYYAVPVANGGKCADNVAAVLPTSRTVQTGKTATAFATIINPAGAAALDCSLGIWGSPVGGFSYSATNSTTNAVVGPLNPTLDIPAGQAQSYVFAISPTAALAEQDVKLRAACANHRPVAPVVGLNTLSFAATVHAHSRYHRAGRDRNRRRHPASWRHQRARRISGRIGEYRRRSNAQRQCRYRRDRIAAYAERLSD